MERIVFTKANISKEEKRFYECPGCNKVHCASCLSSSPRRIDCPSCGMSLLSTKVGIAPFLEEPMIQLDRRTFNVQAAQQDGNIVDVDCDITYSFNFHRITEPPTLAWGVPAEPYYLDLEEKGKVKIKLNNKVVKIGGSWRVLSPCPYQDKLEAMVANRKSKHREKETAFCSQCGSSIKKADKFCWNCGEKNTDM